MLVWGFLKKKGWGGEFTVGAVVGAPEPGGQLVRARSIETGVVKVPDILGNAADGCDVRGGGE